MKPDGTLDIADIMQHIEQLQSWEQVELANKIFTEDAFIERLNNTDNYTLNDYLQNGYVYDEKRPSKEEIDLMDFLEDYLAEEILDYIAEKYDVKKAIAYLAIKKK